MNTQGAISSSSEHSNGVGNEYRRKISEVRARRYRALHWSKKELGAILLNTQMEYTSQVFYTTLGIRMENENLGPCYSTDVRSL